MQININGIRIEACAGDITRQDDCAVVVNAANAQLAPGGGVAGAIHRAAGPGLAAECRPLAPIVPGQAVITRAHGLPNRHVIHCLGPVYGRDEPAEQLLADCYHNALLLADQHALDSIAFPAISTGIFGYPMNEAAAVAVRTVTETTEQLQHIKLIRFVLFGQEALSAHEDALQRLS